MPDLNAAWPIVMAEAWAAYCAGSYPIGACIVNEAGEVLARGRNRLGEARQVDGLISGHRLSHAEVNALLALPDLPPEEMLKLTLVSSTEPCPMCLGAMVMSRVRRLAYATADPWAGHTDALTQTFYFSQKEVPITRAPAEVERFCTLLLVTHQMGAGMPAEHGFFRVFAEQQPERFAEAQALHEAGTFPRLRARGATLAEVTAALEAQ